MPENLRRGRSTELSSKAIEALLKTVGMKQVGLKKNNSWKKGKPSDNSRRPFEASLSANVSSKNLGARRAQFRSKVGLTDQSTTGGTNSNTAVHLLGDDDSQPKNWMHICQSWADQCVKQKGLAGAQILYKPPGVWLLIPLSLQQARLKIKNPDQPESQNEQTRMQENKGYGARITISC